MESVKMEILVDQIPSNQMIKAHMATGLRRRIVSMMIAWIGLGALVGTINGMQVNGGAVGILAQVTAGMLVFVCMGTLLAFVGGKARGSIVGANCGLLVGVLS